MLNMIKNTFIKNLICYMFAVAGINIAPIAPVGEPIIPPVVLQETMEEERAVEEVEAPAETEPVHVHYHVAGRVQAPTCTSVGYTYYTCECGDEYIDDFVDQIGHRYAWENAIVVEPTVNEMGYTRYQCSNCDSAYNTNYVDYMSTIIFYDANETVWANADVNVRMGPSTDYDKVGALSWGETVTRTGIGDNGWSRVEYNGRTAYVHSDYIQTTEPRMPFDGSTPSDEVIYRMNNTGCDGVLYIPSVGMEPVNVYLYHGTAVRSLQSIADRGNSAYMVGVYAPGDRSTNKIEFGDHVNHNFSVLKSIPVGTMAYFNMGNKVVRFKCVETIGYLSMSDYKAGIYQEDGMVVTTCCSGNGRTVNRWAITADSDLTYDEFYQIVNQGEVVYWN